MYRLYWFLYDFNRSLAHENKASEIAEDLSLNYPSDSEEEDEFCAADWDRDYDAAMKQYEDGLEDQTKPFTKDGWDYSQRSSLI